MVHLIKMPEMMYNTKLRFRLRCIHNVTATTTSTEYTTVIIRTLNNFNAMSNKHKTDNSLTNITD